MAALAWLLIPIAAAVLAGIWGSWASRRRTGVPDSAGVAGYERFRAAMERSRGDEADGKAGEEPVSEPVVAAAQPAPDGPARTAD
ncbi:MAG: hypothetical protein ACRDP3_25270 [Streptomyces sp.]|uniref:hypothetical protein n=1 Tax=Streptomyces sp. TaxID=1931 RepID=UPI003D6A7D6D